MTATNHALTGAAIAVTIRQPLLALPLALLSHFICDAVPHWDYILKFPLKKYVAVLDVIFAAVLTLIVVWQVYLIPDWIILGCAFLAVAPDAMWLPHILKGQPIPFDGDEPLYLARRIHRLVQWSETKKGFYIEVLWFSLMIIVIAGANHGLITGPK